MPQGRSPQRRADRGAAALGDAVLCPVSRRSPREDGMHVWKAVSARSFRLVSPFSSYWTHRRMRRAVALANAQVGRSHGVGHAPERDTKRKFLTVMIWKTCKVLPRRTGAIGRESGLLTNSSRIFPLHWRLRITPPGVLSGWVARASLLTRGNCHRSCFEASVIVRRFPARMRARQYYSSFGTFNFYPMLVD